MGLSAKLSPLQNPTLLPRPRRLVLSGVPVDRMSMEDTVAWVIHALRHRAARPPMLMMGPNAQLITLARRNREFAEALRTADLNVADGISIVMAARLLGRPVQERVAGGELMERLCAEAARNNLSVFFLGGLPHAAELAAVNLQRRYPALRIAGSYCPARGFEDDSMESAHVRRLLREAAPDLLYVALGAPKQEIWMHRNCRDLPIGAALSVGAAFDTQAGLRKRAPHWTHSIGMEWLFRLLREPRRLWRRYLLGNPHFLYLVMRQLLRQPRQPVSPDPCLCGAQDSLHP
jgi:N-acetylglucosaminyldiphosphoundecaprenol N-acetyl-beta-D-mannosaminyltransferase